MDTPINHIGVKHLPAVESHCTYDKQTTMTCKLATDIYFGYVCFEVLIFYPFFDIHFQLISFNLGL